MGSHEGSEPSPAFATEVCGEGYVLIWAFRNYFRALESANRSVRCRVGVLGVATCLEYWNLRFLGGSWNRAPVGMEDLQSCSEVS